MGEAKAKEDMSDLRLLPMALDRLGLRLPLVEAGTEDWDPDDTIEIYDPSGVQIYRSFGFFGLCSYTLQDLFLHSEDELFALEPEAKAFWRRHFAMALAGIPVWLWPNERRSFVTEERFSAERWRILTEHRAFLPLTGKKGGPVRAVLVISRRKQVAKTFEPPPPPPPEDPKGKGRDFLFELLKALAFSAAYDLLKWLIFNLEEQATEEEDEVWRPFAA